MTKINIGQKTVFTVPTELDSEKYLSGDGTWKSVASALSGDAPVNVSSEGKISVDVFEGSREGWPECDFEVQEFEVGDGGSSTLHLTAEASEIPSNYTFNAIAHNVTINSNFGYINLFDTVGQYMNDCSAYVGNDTTDRSLVNGQLIGTWDTLVFKFTADKGEGSFDYSCYVQYEKSVKDGKKGLVPAPTTSEAGFFLSADGTWKSAMTHISGNDPISVSESGIIYAKEFLGKGQQLESADFSCTEVVDGILHCELVMYPPALPDYFIATLYLRKLSESDNFTSIQFDATKSSIYKFIKTVKVTEEQATKIKEAIAMTQITLLVDGDGISLDTTVTGTGIPGLVPNTSRIYNEHEEYFLNAKGKWAKPKNDTYSGAEPVKIDENNVISVDVFREDSEWKDTTLIYNVTANTSSYLRGTLNQTGSWPSGHANAPAKGDQASIPGPITFKDNLDSNFVFEMYAGTKCNWYGLAGIHFTSTDIRKVSGKTFDEINIEFTSDGERGTEYTAEIDAKFVFRKNVSGLVPNPPEGQKNLFLRSDATWAEIEIPEVPEYVGVEPVQISSEHKISVDTFKAGKKQWETESFTGNIYSSALYAASYFQINCDATEKPKDRDIMRITNSPLTFRDDLAEEFKIYLYSPASVWTGSYMVRLDATETAKVRGQSFEKVLVKITSDSTGYTGEFIIEPETIEGTDGLVPAPSDSEAEYFLKGDGTWAEAQSFWVGTQAEYNALTDKKPNKLYIIMG